jgi:hypothetical protein
MRRLSRLLPGTLAALVLCLALLAATAVADNGSDTSTSGKDSGSDGAVTSPVTRGAPPTIPANANGDAPAVPPVQAQKEAAGPDARGRHDRSRRRVRSIPVPAPVAPVLGKSMGLRPVDGTVKVRLPQSGGYAALSDAGSIPSGAVVDARRGTVLLRSAIDASGRTQTARIWGAAFEVRQSADGKGMTDLVLRGGRPQGCPAARGAAIARAAAARTTTRSGGLWAQDRHGRFRTRGRNSVATVRGTRWVTRETCAGTLTKVLQGAVDVRDLRAKRTLRVRADHSYVARTTR